jgi:D-glycero-alpha-D-manno-heptose 1-phosphate guanylyltransferase
MMEAVVLAGGFGTRLRAVVADVPKPMAPVAGRPFLEILLGSLARQGLRRVVLSLGYKAELIEGHFGSRFGPLDLVYEIESQPLGTGGALRRALARCHGEAALVVNGDTYLDLDIAAVRAAWDRQRQALIVGLEVPDTRRYGRLRLEQGQVRGFEEKGSTGPGVINTGHYLLPTRLFERCVLADPFSFETDFLAPEVDHLHFAVFMTQGSFIDIGVPEDYERAQTQLAGVA